MKKLICAQRHNSDLAWLLFALAEKMGFDLVTTNLPPIDGEYPLTIVDPSI